MTDNQKNIFSKNLNKLVHASNLPQSEIARRIGVSPQTFNTWTQGKAIPRMKKIQLLADYFNVNKSELIDDSELVPKAKYYDLNENDNQKIQKTLEKVINDLDTGLYSKDLAGYDEESRQLLINALELGLTVAKREAKKRYTPKKYRNED